MSFWYIKTKDEEVVLIEAPNMPMAMERAAAIGKKNKFNQAARASPSWFNEVRFPLQENEPEISMRVRIEYHYDDGRVMYSTL